MIALCLHLGGACPPPHWDLLHLDKFLGEMEGGVGGGWWAHPPALASLGKMRGKMASVCVGFLNIGWSNVFCFWKIDRSSLLFGTIATPKEGLWGQNLKAFCVHDSKHWEWVGLW